MTDPVPQLADIFETNGRLGFRLLDGSLISCTCVCDNYAKAAVAAAHSHRDELIWILQDAIEIIDACDDPESRHWLGQARAAIARSRA